MQFAVMWKEKIHILSDREVIPLDDTFANHIRAMISNGVPEEAIREVFRNALINSGQVED